MMEIGGRGRRETDNRGAAGGAADDETAAAGQRRRFKTPSMSQFLSNRDFPDSVCERILIDEAARYIII